MYAQARQSYGLGAWATSQNHRPRFQKFLASYEMVEGSQRRIFQPPKPLEQKLGKWGI